RVGAGAGGADPDVVLVAADHRGAGLRTDRVARRRLVQPHLDEGAARVGVGRGRSPGGQPDVVARVIVAIGPVVRCRRRDAVDRAQGPGQVVVAAGREGALGRVLQ